MRFEVLITHEERAGSQESEPARSLMPLRGNPFCLSRLGRKTTATLDVFIFAKWLEELEEGKGTLFQAATIVLIRRIARTVAVIP